MESVVIVFQFAIVMYNPFGSNVSTWIRVPVSGKSYSVSDYRLHPVNAQVSGGGRVATLYKSYFTLVLISWINTFDILSMASFV